MEEKNSPFFSVIIPTFNRKKFLKIALCSVIEQTFKDFEVIIIDDGSTDGTREMVAAFDDERIKYHFQRNHGVANARNAGLKSGRGTFLAFLDSDDRWAPQKLERIRDYITRFSKIKIFHTEEVWYRREKELKQKKRHRKPTGHVYLNALPLCCISISTAVVHKSVMEEVGGFDEDFEACEDYDFWLRATHQYEVKLVPEYLTFKDGGRPDQLSSRIWGLNRFRIMSLAKMLDGGKLSPTEYKATYEELIKRIKVFSKGAQKRGRAKEARDSMLLIEKYAL